MRTELYAACATCGEPVDISDIPFFSGVVYCSNDCLARRSTEPPVYAVAKQSPTEQRNVSLSEEDL